MSRRHAASKALALVLLGALAGVSIAAAAEPRRKRIGKTVESNEITDGTIQCEDLSPDVFPDGCGADAEPAVVESGAQNVFVDGFTTTDQPLPSTPSGNDPAASIAKLQLGEGTHVIFASIVWSGNPLDFSGIVTCHLAPPNGPNSKAEFIGQGTTTGTLFVQTTSSGPGTVDFRCSDQSEDSTVLYRFLQLTAIQVPSLVRRNLLP